MTTIDRPSSPAFICPYCQSPLTVDAKTWHCDGSHNAKATKHPFDVARQGYVNLLPVNHKRSKDPGDSQDSINARHRFLSQGYYQPLQHLISSIISSNNESSIDQTPPTWLDIGCGEGYYTQAIARSLEHSLAHSQAHSHARSRFNKSATLIALDISKPAVATTARVAKQNTQLWYQASTPNLAPPTQQTTVIYPIVASASQLPLADDCLHGISTIFSPIVPKAFARVLKVGGKLIIAKPDKGHLQSLRDALFDEVRPHDSDKFLADLMPHFKLLKAHHVQAEMTLDKPSLTDLLTMTPYSYRARPEKREALIALAASKSLQNQARFVVYELVKI